MRRREYCGVQPARIACNPGIPRAVPARASCEKLRHLFRPVVDVPSPEQKVAYWRDADDLAWMPQFRRSEINWSASSYFHSMLQFSGRYGRGRFHAVTLKIACMAQSVD